MTDTPGASPVREVGVSPALDTLTSEVAESENQASAATSSEEMSTAAGHAVAGRGGRHSPSEASTPVKSGIPVREVGEDVNDTPNEPTHVVGYALTFVDGTVLHEPVEIGTHDGCRKIMQALPEWDCPLEVELKDWGFFIVTLEEFDAIQLGSAA